MNGVTPSQKSPPYDIPAVDFALPRTESVVLKTFKEMKESHLIPVPRGERIVEQKRPRTPSPSPLMAEDTIASFYNID